MNIIRRITLLPLIIICSPLMYFIGWCYAGYKESWNILIGFIKETYNRSIY